MRKNLLDNNIVIVLSIDDMMVLVPTSDSLRAMIPAPTEDSADPLENSYELMHWIVTSHLIKGKVPQRVFDRVPV